MKSKTLKYSLKIFFTLSIFGLIIYGFQKKLGSQENILEQIIDNFSAISWGWLLAAIITYISGSMLAALRISMLAKAHGIAISYIQMLKNLYVGFLFNPLLMGSTGGDIVRSYYLCRQTGKKTEIVTIVFLDRFIGIYVVVFLCMSAVMFNLSDSRFQSILYGDIMLFLFLLVFTVIVFSRRITGKFSFIKKFTGDSKLTEIIRKSVQTLQDTKKYKKIILLSALCTIIFQSLCIMACYLASRSLLNIPPVSIRYFFLFLPVIFTIQAVPVSLGGLGVGEAAFAALFLFVGVERADAISISLIFRIVIIVMALIGGLVYLSPDYEKVDIDKIDYNP